MGGGRVWGHVAGVWIRNRGSGLVHGRRDVAGVGTCGRVWGHVAGCGDMWQGGGRVWGHVAGVWIRLLHEHSWSALAMCKLLCANCYVQTAMCKLLCANWSCKMTFLLVTSLIMVRF